MRGAVRGRPRRWRPRAWSESRRVWAAVIAVGVVLTAILLVELARPRDFLTGTNSAGSDGAIVHVDPGQRLCLHGLEIPDGTGRLQLRLRSTGATTLVAEVAAGGGPVERRQFAVAPSRGGPQATPAPLDVPTRAARNGMAALCVSPSGPIDLAGRHGLESGQPAPLLDGRPVDARVAVWYLPPLDERKSLLAQIARHVRPCCALPPGRRRSVDIRRDPHRPFAGALRCGIAALRASGRGPTRAQDRTRDRSDRLSRRGVVVADHARLQRP